MWDGAIFTVALKTATPFSEFTPSRMSYTSLSLCVLILLFMFLADKAILNSLCEREKEVIC